MYLLTRRFVSDTVWKMKNSLAFSHAMNGKNIYSILLIILWSKPVSISPDYRTIYIIICIIIFVFIFKSITTCSQITNKHIIISTKNCNKRQGPNILFNEGMMQCLITVIMAVYYCGIKNWNSDNNISDETTILTLTGHLINGIENKGSCLKMGLIWSTCNVLNRNRTDILPVRAIGRRYGIGIDGSWICRR